VFDSGTVDHVTGPVSAGQGSALFETYEAYCRHEASSLLSLIPREAVRTLYGRARDWALEAGLHEQKDPMATLHAFCRRLLPLPPFDVWLEDYEGHRLLYMQELAGIPHAPPDPVPVAVELRNVPHEGEEWFATLNVVHDGEVWRGHIAFHTDTRATLHCTADIFCEESLAELRQRFRTFTPASLSAFLRSTLA
jgi:hypothetical protein